MGGMNLKKVAVITGIAIVIFFIVAHPDQASGLVHNILATLRSWAESLVNFVGGVFK